MAARDVTIHHCRSIHRLIGEWSNCIDATPKHRCILLYYTLSFWQSPCVGVCENMSARRAMFKMKYHYRLFELSRTKTFSTQMQCGTLLFALKMDCFCFKYPEKQRTGGLIWCVYMPKKKDPGLNFPQNYALIYIPLFVFFPVFPKLRIHLPRMLDDQNDEEQRVCRTCRTTAVGYRWHVQTRPTSHITPHCAGASITYAKHDCSLETLLNSRNWHHVGQRWRNTQDPAQSCESHVALERDHRHSAVQGCIWSTAAFMLEESAKERADFSFRLEYERYSYTFDIYGLRIRKLRHP